MESFHALSGAPPCFGASLKCIYSKSHGMGDKRGEREKRRNVVARTSQWSQGHVGITHAIEVLQWMDTDSWEDSLGS